jgi:hypothetical protein
MVVLPTKAIMRPGDTYRHIASNRIAVAGDDVIVARGGSLSSISWNGIV